MKNFLFILTTIFVLNCNKEESPIVNGQVLLSDGTPVENAAIHYVPKLASDSLSKQKRQTTAISFSLPKAGKVKLETFIAWDHELLETLIDWTLSAGTHFVTLNDTLYTNRVYEYELSIPDVDTTIVHRMLRVATAEQLIGFKPLVKTNSVGSFKIENGELGIGEKFRITSQYGPDSYYDLTITNVVEFIAIKNEQIIARKEVEIMEEKQNDVKLVVNN